MVLTPPQRTASALKSEVSQFQRLDRLLAQRGSYGVPPIEFPPTLPPEPSNESG